MTKNKKTNQKQKKEEIKKKINENKIIQLLTLAPELVTLNCSLTHVLQAFNTRPCHS